MRINSLPGVKCFCNNKNVLCVQVMVRHFVRHSVCTVTKSKPSYLHFGRLFNTVGQIVSLTAVLLLIYVIMHSSIS